jgi:ATP-dependent exoDNAse (exonuclease V) alpha subunit
MHSLLPQLQAHGGPGPRTLLVIDEAGMAPTRRSADLFAWAERAGAKVVAVGDPGQLGAVEAGGWLAALIQRQPAATLREVIRQPDPAEQHALQALHDGDPTTYLAHKHDAITIHNTELEALLKLTDDWHAAQLRHGRRDAVMITRDNLTRERLNRTARARLITEGTIPSAGTIIAGREYAIGDRVITRQNDRQRNLDNGTLGTIITVNDGRLRAGVSRSPNRRVPLLSDRRAGHERQHTPYLTSSADQASLQVLEQTATLIGQFRGTGKPVSSASSMAVFVRPG